MTPAQCDTMVAIYELAGDATVPAVALRLKISAWAMRARLQGLIREGWVSMQRPLRRLPGRARLVIVPSYPAVVDVAGERYRLVQLDPPRAEP